MTARASPSPDDPGRVSRDLAERRKELAGLYRVTALLRGGARPVPVLLAEIAATLCPAFQYPDVTTARAEFGGHAASTPAHRETPWMLASRFKAADGREGAIQVAYLDERPASEEGPFLAEERQLLDNVAAMLCGHLDRLAVEDSLRAAQDRLRLILDSVGEGIHGLDAAGRIVFENPAAIEAFGGRPGALVGQRAHETLHRRADGRAHSPEECPIRRTLRDGVVRRVPDGVFLRPDGSSFPVEYVCAPLKDEHGVVGAVVSFRDTTARRHAEMLQAFDAEIMEAISSGVPFADVLAAIALGVERLEVDGLASILRFDGAARRLHAGAAPSLPLSPGAAADGWPAGPAAGSCGTAAYRREAVHVADILADPLWEDHRQPARLLHERTGVRACWSTPVLDRGGRVQATFAIYHREARLPRPEELVLVDHATRLVRLLFDRERREESLRESEARLATRVRQQETLARLSAEALRSIDLRAALQNAAEAVAEVIAAPFAKVLELAADASVFRLVAGVGWRAGAVGTATVAVGNASQAGYTLGVRDVVCVEDFATETRFVAPPLLREHGVVSGLSVMIEAEGRPWGVLSVHAGRPRPFATDERDFLLTVSHLLSVILGRFASQQRLEASERNLRSTFAEAAAGIAVTALDGRFLEANAAYCRMLEYSEDELRSLDVLGVTHAEDRETNRALLAELLAGDRNNFTLEKRYLAKSGRVVWVRISVAAQRNATGQPVRLVGIAEDITERRQFERQLLRTQRMESVGTLAGGLAHDLNNLLAPITMGVDLLKLFELNPESRRVIGSIESNAHRCAQLVKQVMSYARGVDGARVAVRLPEIARDIQGIAEGTFPKNIVCSIDAPEDLWAVTGDPAQLNQVLLNLCVNARDALPRGGTLSIAMRNVEIDPTTAAMNREVRPGRYVLLAVEDNGVGISQENLERVFDPFFTTKSVGQGTGLGLSAVQGIVRSHGGFIRVSSQRGVGSRFEVFLPAADPEGSATASSEARPAPEATGLKGKGECVLVVDDEPPILRVVRQTLEAYNYTVLTAEDGAHAIEVFVANRERIALVLTDLMMPVMDGVALVASLRRLHPDLRIIAATGLDVHANLSRIAQEGVREILPKPYTAEALLGAVARELAARR